MRKDVQSQYQVSERSKQMTSRGNPHMPAPTIELVNLDNPGQMPAYGTHAQFIVHNPPKGNKAALLVAYSALWENPVPGGPGYLDQWGKTDDDDNGPDWVFDFTWGVPEHGHNSGGHWLENPSTYAAYVLDGTDFSKTPLALTGGQVLP